MHGMARPGIDKNLKLTIFMVERGPVLLCSVVWEMDWHCLFRFGIKNYFGQAKLGSVKLGGMWLCLV